MKVKFEIDIAKVVNNPLSTKDEWALDENNKFKAVLIEDPLGAHQIQFVNSYYGEGEGKYASLQYFPLPIGTKIIEDEGKPTFEEAEEARFNEIKESIDTIKKSTSEMFKMILKELEEGSGSGISEKTLLEALKIVSNNSNTKQ